MAFKASSYVLSSKAVIEAQKAKLLERVAYLTAAIAVAEKMADENLPKPSEDEQNVFAAICGQYAPLIAEEVKAQKALEAQA